MAQTIVVPSGDRLEFPDGMADADIEKAIFAEYPDLAPKPGVFDRIKSALTPSADRAPAADYTADDLAASVATNPKPADPNALPGSVMDGFVPKENTRGMPIEAGMGPMRQSFYDETRGGLLSAPIQVQGQLAQNYDQAVKSGRGGDQVGKIAAESLPGRVENLERDLSGDIVSRSQQELADDTNATLMAQPLRSEAAKEANRQWLTENSAGAIEGIKRFTKMDQADAEAELAQMIRYGVKPAWVDGSMPEATLAQAASANIGATGPALQKALLGLSEAAADQPMLQLPWKDYAKRTPRELEAMVADLDKQIRTARNVGGKIEAGSWNDVVSTMGPSLATNMPPLIAAALVAAKNPAAGMAIANGGLGVMGLQKFGDSYLKGQMKGLSAGDNLTQASLGAAAEIIPEKLSLNALFAAFKTLGKGAAIETVKAFAKQQLTEHATEQVTTIADHLIEKAYTEPNKSLESLWSEMKQTAMATAIQAPILAAGGAAAHITGQAAVSAQQRLAEGRDITAGMQFNPAAIDAAARQALSPDNAQRSRTGGLLSTPVVPRATPADVANAETPEAAAAAIADMGAGIAPPATDAIISTQADIDAILSEPILEAAAAEIPAVQVPEAIAPAATDFISQDANGQWALSRPIANQPPEVVASIIAELDRLNAEPTLEADGPAVAAQGAPQAAPETGAVPGELTPASAALESARPWDQANRNRRGDEWFEGARANEDAIAGFTDALANGGSNLQAHGMGKERTLGGGIQNLLNMLSNGLDANRGGGMLQTAPLVSRPGEGLVGATASGSAYSDGPFMLVARPGESLTGNLSGLGAVLINQAHADIAPQIAAAIHAIRPDIIVAPYSDAGSVAKQLVGKVGAGDAAPNASVVAQNDANSVNPPAEGIVTPQSDKSITRTKGGKLEIVGFDRDEVADTLKTAKITATVVAGKDGRIIVSTVGRDGNPEKMPIKTQNAINTALLGKTAKAPKPRKFTGNLRNDINLLAPGLYAEVARGGDGGGVEHIDLSIVAEQLLDEGYSLPRTETGKGSDAVIEIIRQDIANGGGTLNERRMVEAMTQEETKRHRSDVLRLADEYGIPAKENGIWRKSEDVLDDVERAIKHEIGLAGRSVVEITKSGAAAGAFTNAEAKSLALEVAEGYRDDQGRDAKVRMYREIANLLQDKINERESTESREVGRGSGEGRGTPGEAEAERPALELAGQTEAELRAEQERIDAAKEAEEAEAKEAEAKARKEQAAKDKAGIQDRLANQPFEFGVGAKEAKKPQRDIFDSPVDSAANQAATSPTNDTPAPTPAQMEAGNYAKGHIRLHGFDISIENPKGSERVAKDGSWRVPSMPAHYGYIKGTVGADKEHLDVFVGPNPESTKVWIINQIAPSSSPARFDEHKVMMGFDSAAEAKGAYLASFEGDFGGHVFGSLTAPLTIDQLKAKIEAGELSRKKFVGPVAEAAAEDAARGEKVGADGTAADFIKSPAGSIDFGEITAEQAKAMKRQAGKIRLERGIQNADGTGYGLDHIEANHGKQIRGAGFGSVEEFVAHVAKDFGQVWQAKGRQVLVAYRDGEQHMMYVQLEQAKDEAGNYYRVNSAFPVRQSDYPERHGFKKLWDGSEPASAVAGEQPAFAGQPEEASGQATPNARGQSKQNIADKPTNGNTEDAGAELTYNRRNRITRGLKWEDIADKNVALRVKEVAKAKVFPKPDYQALVDDGTNPLVAHLVKQVYDSIATVPSMGRRQVATDADMKLYIEAVNRVMDGVQSWATDRAAVAKWAMRQANGAAAAMGKPTSLSDLESVQTLLDTVYPGGWKNYRQEVILLGGNKLLGALQPGYDEVQRATKDIAKGWPGKRESWQQQGYRVLQADDEVVRVKPTNVDGGYFIEVAGKYQTRFNDKASADQAASDLDPWLLLDKRGQIVSGHPSEVAATEAARAVVERKSKAGEIHEKGRAVADAERTGPARRMEGEDISSDRLKDDFGFRGINFGEWMKGDSPSKVSERQLHLNHAYDAFLDLAEILNVPPKAMSLNGMLGLAIGAQGGGKALAHFVPGVNEINLTRTGGAGALAHEWGHALDHYFGTLGGLEREKRPYLTEHASVTRREAVVIGGRTKLQEVALKPELRPEILDRFKAIVAAMTKRAETATEAKQRLETNAKRYADHVESWLRYIRKEFAGATKPGEADMDAARTGALETFDNLAARIGNLDLGEGMVAISRDSAIVPVVAEMRDAFKAAFGRFPDVDSIKALQANIDGLRAVRDRLAADVEHEPQQIATDYQKASNAADEGKKKPYWGSKVEMFARAFDAFVVDTLAESAAKNSYLAGIEAVPPQGEERKTIDAAFRDLIAEIQTKETDTGVAMFSRADSPLDGGVSVDSVREATEQLLDGLKNSPPVRVVWSPSDLPFKAPADTRGVYHRGILWMVAGGIRSAEDVREVAFHELTHFGLRGFFGAQLDTALGDIHEANPRVRLMAAAWQRKNADLIADLKADYALSDGDIHYISIDEALAKIAQTGETLKGWKRFAAVLQSLLRTAGLTRLANALEARTDAEALAMLKKAELFARRGWTAKSYMPDAAYPMFMTAYHGTPHEVDRFSTEHIGTGEGAQAYGWGLYFAGRKDVAEWYRKKLASDELWSSRFTRDGETLVGREALREYFKPGRRINGYAGIDEVISFNEGENFNWSVKVKAVEDQFGKTPNSWDAKPRVHATEPKASEIDKVLAQDGWKRHAGRVYTVELAPKEDEYLDWDKPLSEQSETVKAAIDKLAANLFNSNKTPGSINDQALEVIEREGDQDGADLYQELEAIYASDQYVSELLHSIGIRGIRYRDGTSRSRDAGEAQHNYVIFDDSDVTVTGQESRSEVMSRETAEKIIAASRGGIHTGETVRSIRAGLHQSIGKAVVDRLEQKGLLRIVGTVSDLPRTLLQSQSLEEVADRSVGGVERLRYLGIRSTTGPHGERLVSIPRRSIANLQSSALESKVDGASVDAELPGDGGDAFPVHMQGMSGSNIPSDRAASGKSGSSSRDSASLEGGPDSGPVNAERVSDLLERSPMFAQLASLFDAPRQGLSVKSGVILNADKLKIVDGVIQSIPIDMMDVLASGKTTANVPFHDVPVFSLPGNALIENLSVPHEIASSALSDFPGRFGHRDTSYNTSYRVSIPQGIYSNGVAYLIADQIHSGEAVKVILHEIGEHHGLEGMLGKEGYATLVRRVRAMDKFGNKRVREAFSTVRELYPEYADNSAEFMHEVLANIGQDADIQAKLWWQEMLAVVKRWIVQLGYGGLIKPGDIQDMVLHSLMVSAGKNQVEDSRGMVPAMASKVGAGGAEVDYAGSLAMFLQEKTGTVLGRWKGKMPAADQRALFGRVLGKGTIVIDGERETVANQVKVAFGQDYDDRAVTSWRDLNRAPSESRQTRQQALPNTGAPPAPAPVRQTPMGLQGGATGNNASWNGYQASKLDDVIRTLQDNHIDSKRTVQAIKAAGRQVADKWDVYLQESLFHGRAAKRTLEFVDTELTPLAQDLAMRGLTLDELDQYLHARHAGEANALIAQRNPAIPDGGSGMTNQQALDYFANLDPSKRRRLEASAARVDAIIDRTRRLYVSYGLESQETIDGWADTFQHYVPLMREDKDGGMGIGQGFSVKGKESKSRTGSTRAVVDILANIAMQRERAVVRGEKNRVSVSLLGLAKLNPNPDFWMTDRIPMITGLNPATGLVETYPDPGYKSRENVVVAKIPDGRGGIQERAVVFNEGNELAMNMARALKNLDAAQLEGLMGAASRVTRYFASINTQYNPVFGVTNLVRDVQDAMLNLSSTPIAGHKADVLKHTLGALRGIYIDTRQMRKGQPATSTYAQLWEEFQREGGQTGYRDMFRTSADRANAIEKAIDPTKWMDSTLGQVFTAGGALRVPMAVAQQKATWLFDWLSDYNESMENAVRLAAYKVGLEQGMSKQQAAAMAKSLTVNFNRKGQIGMQAGALYAFFNASMQGTGRIAQTLFTIQGNDIKTVRLSKAGQKIVAGGILLGSLQALMLMAAGFGEDEPPEFVRERNTIIPIGNKKYVTIPMPLGFAVLPNIGRIATEFVMGGFKNPAKHVTRLLGIAADAFNPIGGNGTVLQMVTPTALDPLAAIAENKDWTKKPIAKVAYDKTTPGHKLWKDTASTPGKLIAEAINTMSGGNKYVAGSLSPTPDQIDYLFGQVTGGVGRELSKTEQSIMATVRGEDLPPHKIPLVGRFYGDANAQSSQGTTFYGNINRINEYEAEIKGLRKDGRGTEAAKFIAEHPEARLVIRANYAERQVQKLRKEKHDLVEKDAPRERIKALEDRIKAEMTRFNEAVKASKQREKEAA